MKLRSAQTLSGGRSLCGGQIKPQFSIFPKVFVLASARLLGLGLFFICMYALAARHKLPAVYFERFFVTAAA